MKEGSKIYLQQNVYEAAVERIAHLFDHFEQIVISLSGGKDSGALVRLCADEAIRRHRQIHVFFLDQEAEYQSTIEVIRYWMGQDVVIPHWYQVPIQMTNAASMNTDFLNAWGEGETWMREKDPLAIHAIEGKYPARFYKFFPWFENQFDKAETCFLVGLRAEESLDRFRTMVKHPGWNGHLWTSQSKKSGIKAYPLYDWTYEDIWHYTATRGVVYNRIYDYLYFQGYRINDIRVSYLAHENSLKSLSSLQEFEPDTYARLLARMPGIATAARYIKEKTMYAAGSKPEAFSTWKAYRDFLIQTTTSEHIKRFEDRFKKQGDDEYTCRQQVKQLLMNDWEQNIPIRKKSTPNKEEMKKKWREIL